ncbi:lysozyme inhibitor LprI family protein [Pararhodobacter oceanensis]|uniref:lysozyme inhibitor LprI family protein n=1 Tax=Pararhodobacter oceanensis TaxID=2172121 RepID=UPI003A9090AA
MTTLAGRVRRLLLAAAMAGVGAAAQAQTVDFDPAVAQSCLDRGDAGACIGLAADHCMLVTPGGGSTAGMGFCLRAELEWWDAALNTAYGQMVAQAQRIDASDSGTPGRPSDIEALRAMQRAWIAYRDASCSYEELQWWGGTGAHGAGLSCRLQLTAAQTLRLRAMIYHE